MVRLDGIISQFAAVYHASAFVSGIKHPRLLRPAEKHQCMALLVAWPMVSGAVAMAPLLAPSAALNARLSSRYQESASDSFETPHPAECANCHGKKKRCMLTFTFRRHGCADLHRLTLGEQRWNGTRKICGSKQPPCNSRSYAKWPTS